MPWELKGGNTKIHRQEFPELPMFLPGLVTTGLRILSPPIRRGLPSRFRNAPNRINRQYLDILKEDFLGFSPIAC